ncbi:MAG: C1 family peptidase, partial [Desulfobacterales bacterium]|nr:C1 family peptidase [Desulfobacterales bacterium]
MFKKIMLAFLISSCMSVVSLADESILTLEEIQNAITEKGLHWSAGKTSVSDLSMEEKKGLCGLVIPPEVESDISRVNKEPEATLSKFGQQTRWDWREHSGVTAVKDQKSCASCWAFAAIGALESAVKISPPHTELDLSEQQVVSCNTWGGTCAGGWPESAYELFRDYGAIDESNMPYQSSDTVACTQNSWEPLVKIEAWSHFIPNNVNDIKNALATGPITSSMTIYQDLYSYTSGCYVHASGGLVAKHEVLIIGWDDALCGGQGGWIVKNSWGTSWGEGGFFNIRYGNCNIGDGGQLVEYPALFYGKIDYGAGASPRSPFFADLDGDSDLDLVVTNGDMKVSILKNNGNGTFQAPVKYGVGYDPHSVFCADLDGDGDLDLAVANFL